MRPAVASALARSPAKTASMKAADIEMRSRRLVRIIGTIMEHSVTPQWPARSRDQDDVE